MAGWVWEAEHSTDGERDVRFTRSDARQGTQHQDRYLRDSSFARLRLEIIVHFPSSSMGCVYVDSHFGSNETEIQEEIFVSSFDTRFNRIDSPYMP